MQFIYLLLAIALSINSNTEYTSMTCQVYDVKS